MADSPFRSYLLKERQAAADKILLRRERELCSLERKWRAEGNARRQRLLLYRIKATRANIVSWQGYVKQGCPRVPNATTLV